MPVNMNRMPTRIPVLVLAMVLCTTVSSANAQTWSLVWSDEFDQAGSPDTSKWAYDIGGSGWGNNELQYYTDRPENARVENGSLIVEARKELFNGREYTSARLTTRSKADWLYGRVEVRAKLPTGVGSWPAIWMLPVGDSYGDGGWPDNGEIDIMEHVGFDQDRIHGTVHTEKYNHSKNNQKGNSLTVAGASTAYHVYTIEWSPKRIEFFVDDTLYYIYHNENEGWISWPFDKSFRLILNVAVGGDWGGQQGVDDSSFPQVLEVDYVRVYENTSLPSIDSFSPADSASLDIGSSIDLSAAASVENGTLSEVLFLQGDGILASDDTPPFGTTVEDLAPGCYEVRVVALDNMGWSTSSVPVNIMVGNECVPAPYLMRRAPIPGMIEAENYDTGGSTVSYRDLDAQNTGGGIRENEGVDIEPSSDGGYNLTDVSNREWVQYSTRVANDGVYALDVRYASNAVAEIQIDFDGSDKTGVLSLPSTNGLWQTKRFTGIELATVDTVMRVNFQSSGIKLNNLFFEFVSGTSTETISPNSTALHIDAFPNPTDGMLTLNVRSINSGLVSISIIDATGRERKKYGGLSAAETRKQYTVDTGDLAPGLYLVRAQSGKEVATTSLVVTR